MEKLNYAERELVAIGAAIASNCVPCVEYHIPEARKAGLTDEQINEAIQLADKVRQVPARKVLAVAESLLHESQAEGNPQHCGPDRCQAGPAGRSRFCCG